MTKWQIVKLNPSAFTRPWIAFRLVNGRLIAHPCHSHADALAIVDASFTEATA